MTSPRVVFVLSPYQNAFFAELAEALSGAITTAGVETITITEAGAHDVADNDVFVLLPPHEYMALEGGAFVEDERVAARTIGISAEQPHQQFFERNASIGAGLGAVLDFSRTAVAAYRRLGVEADQLPFGYVPAWDRFASRRHHLQSDLLADRQVVTPVLYLGNKRERRLTTLARAADTLAAHGARLVVSDNLEPNRETDTAFFTGERKRDLLAGTGVLVNIHQSDEPYFEWLRFVEAAHCGAVVLTERSVDTEPFRDGEHFASFDRTELGMRLTELVADPARCEDIAGAAYTRLCASPLSETVGVLLETARRLLAAPTPGQLAARTRTAPIGRDRSGRHPINSWARPSGPIARLRRRFSDRSIVLAPAGTSWRVPPADLLRSVAPRAFVNVLADGRTADGAPMLEGFWPWQPWRLRHGEHLGRVLVADPDLVDAARAWLPDQRFDDHPNLRVQLFAAAHGVEGGHVATPLATLTVPVDAGHAVPPDIAEHALLLLDGV